MMERSSPGDSQMQSIEDIIRLREEAVQKLLEEKEELEGELTSLTARLAKIDEQLGRLGHVTTPQVSSAAARRRRGEMVDGLYQARYKGQVYTLRVQSGVGAVDDIKGEFHSLTAAAAAVKKAVTGKKMTASGPRFWKKVD
jgi:hypothetical protein